MNLVVVCMNMLVGVCEICRRWLGILFVRGWEILIFAVFVQFLMGFELLFVQLFLVGVWGGGGAEVANYCAFLSFLGRVCKGG